MSVYIKSGFLVQILVFLSSCSLIGGLGFGSEDVCADGACETSRILDNSQLQTKWYCYGVAADRSWDCVSEPQPEKIMTVIPAQVKSPPLAPARIEELTRPSLMPGDYLPGVTDPATPPNPDAGASTPRSKQRAHSH